jgi:multiple sugar transport system permease protein
MLKKIISWVLITGIILMVLLPILYITIHSLKGQALIISLYEGTSANLWQKIIIKPFYINLDQYYVVLFRTPKLLYMFWNSIGVVLPIVIGQVAVAFLAAYGFSKLKFAGSETLFFFYIVIMLMPFQVTIVPNYIMLNKLNLLDTKAALILPGIFNTFSVFFLKQFMEGIDKNFLEEARLIGAKEFQVLRYIIFPMCKPVIVSVLVFVFIDYWSMVEQPITFLKTDSKFPLSVYLSTITSSKIGIGFACSVLYMVLPVFFALYAQNDLSEGLSITNLK